MIMMMLLSCFCLFVLFSHCPCFIRRSTYSADYRISEASGFKGMNSFNSCSSWTTNIVFELSRVLARFQYLFSCTHHSLGSKLHCYISWYTLFHTSISHCFNEHEYISWATATHSSKGVKQFLLTLIANTD